MARLLDFFGYISVLLRAATLCFQSLAIGGIFFLVVVARGDLRSDRIVALCRRWIAGSAFALAFTQMAYVLTNGAVLMGSAGLALGDVLGANFLYAGVLAVFASLWVGVVCVRGRWQGGPLLLLPAILILVSSVMTSHALARMDDRVLLIFLTALHQGATASWIGGLPYLFLSLRCEPDRARASRIGAGFSRVALVSVILLVCGGAGLSWAYVGSWWGLYGTSYGVMVATKAVLLGCLVALGALNFRIVRRSPSTSPARFSSLSRFLEAEIGIGLTVVLAAASLTSQPPAIDVSADRVTAPEILERFSPRAPRLTSPPLALPPMSALAASGDPWASSASIPEPPVSVPKPGQLSSSSNAGWSEYNHNWAGIFVCAMGLLALAARTGHAPWARYWPAVFFVLAFFLFLRSDPECWPMGPQSYWRSFSDPEVLQHRVEILLIVAFGLFEIAVVNRRFKPGTAELVFPAVCALGGALLLTHSHDLANVKKVLLAEMSHAPIAVLGVMAGWSRWLELRLPTDDRSRRVLSWIWPACFVLIGLILIDYRET